MKTYDQALFDKLIESAKDLGLDVYPTLPKQNVPYPFVNVGEIQRLSGYSKTHYFPLFSVSITVWGKQTQRDKIAEIVDVLWREWTILIIGDVKLKLRETSSSYRIWEQPQSPSLTLWRGDMELEFYI